MLSGSEYIKESLALHLFFARIMKEHAFFLGIGFTPRDIAFTRQADAIRLEFERLLTDTVALANGVVNPSVLQSGEVVTPYTVQAETLTSFYTGVPIQTGLTQQEAALSGGSTVITDPALEQRVNVLNQRALTLIPTIIQFKTIILNNVLSCKMFTTNYPLMIQHIIREANHYLQMVQIIQRREDAAVIDQAYREEVFWNHIMGEHAEFQRGLLDPSEKDLIKKSNDFALEFEQLTKETEQARGKIALMRKVTDRSLTATRDISRFNEQGTQGLIGCKVKSIIIPLLAEHVLRESNHDLRQLIAFQRALSR